MKLKSLVFNLMTPRKKTMKKVKLLIIVLLILAWGTFQMVVTPWGELTGELVFNTNRILGSKGIATVVRQEGKNNTIIINEGFYDYRWSPDGKRIAAFSGKKTEVALLSLNGNVLRRIEMPEKILGIGLQWLPNNTQVLEVEKSGSIWDAFLPVHLTIYDFSTGKRIPFYNKDNFSIMDIVVTK